MSLARFRVAGRFDGAPSATVEINRGAGLISVRPYRRRRAYELRLSDVAAWVIFRVVRAELGAKLAARARGRRKGRRP